MRKTLVYGFEKFDNLQVNPSEAIGKILKEKLKESNFEFVLLPTTFECWKVLEQKINEFKPEIILGIGVAGGRPRVNIETIALNIMDNDKPDNEGKILKNTKINANSPVALETNMDATALKFFFDQQQIPSKISFHAGTFVCNYAYFQVLDHLKETNFKMKTIFIHVPFSTEETIRINLDIPSLPISFIANALEGFIQSL